MKIYDIDHVPTNDSDPGRRVSHFLTKQEVYSFLYKTSDANLFYVTEWSDAEHKFFENQELGNEWLESNPQEKNRKIDYRHYRISVIEYDDTFAAPMVYITKESNEWGVSAKGYKLTPARMIRLFKALTDNVIHGNPNIYTEYEIK